MLRDLRCGGVNVDDQKFVDFIVLNKGGVADLIIVYAIYNKNLYIAFGCALLLVGQFAAMSICIAGKVETRNAINAIDVETLSGSFPYLGWVPLGCS